MAKLKNTTWIILGLVLAFVLINQVQLFSVTQTNTCYVARLGECVQVTSLESPNICLTEEQCKSELLCYELDVNVCNAITDQRCINELNTAEHPELFPSLERCENAISWYNKVLYQSGGFKFTVWMALLLVAIITLIMYSGGRR